MAGVPLRCQSLARKTAVVPPESMSQLDAVPVLDRWKQVLERAGVRKWRCCGCHSIGYGGNDGAQLSLLVVLGRAAQGVLVMNRYWMTEQAVVTCSAVMEP